MSGNPLPTLLDPTDICPTHQVLDQYLNLTEHDKADRARMKAVKSEGVALFAPEEGGSYGVWDERPLHPALVDYAGLDVKFLFEMVDYFYSCHGRGTKEYEKTFQKVASISQERVDNAIASDQPSMGPEKRFRDF
jgi:hypothetical protein